MCMMSISTKCGSRLLKESDMALKKGLRIWSMKSFLASRRFKVQVQH